MNPTVMTTGPGVIIATATASRNWRSFSHPNSRTTPPWRNGTIARPLPNTKAPASVKYQPIRQSVSGVAGAARPVIRTGGSAIAPSTGERPRSSGERTRTASSPAPRKTHRTSDSVQAVTIAAIENSPHSRMSRPSVRRVSFTALRAMTAITAAPMP
jgi:hypothetical protein